MREHFPDFREPKDIDIFSDEDIPKSLYSKRVEVFWHPRLAEYSWTDGTASIDELYTIKVSHSFWELRNGSWDKHMWDTAFLKRNGAKLIPGLYSLLYSIWEERHGKKKANLEQEPEDFFNSNVDRVYEHDSIHASVAYYDEPLFNRILRDNSQVAVSRAKWEALPDQIKDEMVREEVYATALERKLIPANYKMHPKVAYAYALKKTITSFTKGWFPLYIVDNFEKLRQPDIDYVARHKYNEDKLIPLKGKNASE